MRNRDELAESRAIRKEGFLVAIKMANQTKHAGAIA